jgi:hypothetical protein
MNDTKLRELVAEAVGLDREISLQQDRLKEMKARLVIEAQSRLDEAAETEGGGKAIVFQGLAGDVARVNIPGPALKSKIDSEGKVAEKIKAAAGPFFESLFVPAVAYVPIEGFRAEAAALLGQASGRLVKLCETESRPRVCFETKECGAGNLSRNVTVHDGH